MPECCTIRIVLREEAPRVVVRFTPAPAEEPTPEPEDTPGGPLFTAPHNLVWLTNFF